MERTRGGGYYGKEKGWLNGNQVVLSEDEEFRPYGTIEEMVSTTIDELIATASVKKQGFGGLWHVINHAAGIAQLACFGHDQVAQEALALITSMCGYGVRCRMWRTSLVPLRRRSMIRVSRFTGRGC